MAIDNNVEIKSATGIDGNSYTTAISNDKLTNDDFLKLLIEEMKMQDPTKPMDSAKMMDSQLQMSTIEANLDMSKAMKSLQASYANSALSNATGLIGHIVENGTVGQDGVQKSFKVETIENKDGKIYMNTKEMVGLTDNLAYTEDGTTTHLNYDVEGYIYDTDGNKTDNKVKLDDDGRFVFDNGNIVLLDKDDNVITDTDITDKYKYDGTTINYAKDFTTMLMSDVKKVR